MKSESQIKAELKELQKDLLDWNRQLERCRIEDERRRTIGNTICGVEGRIEALEWVLREH